MSARLKGKTAVVTGAARGIGKNIARRLAGEGARVLIADIDAASGRATAGEFKKAKLKADYLPCDLGRAGGAARMIKDAVGLADGVDILVNNARSGKRAGLLDETEQTWDMTMLVTLKSAFFASQEAIKQMKKTGGGAIVNIASIGAGLVTTESPSYHSAKAGMVQMTRFLAAHAGRFGVRVNAVLPGFIVQDEHWQRYQRDDNAWYRAVAEGVHPVGRPGRSDDVAQAVAMLCAPDASFITGQTVVVDGGTGVQEQFDLGFRLAKGKTS